MRFTAKLPVVTLLWCFLFATPSGIAQESSTDELLSAMRAAFEAPRPELVPQVVIFPAVDGQNRVRPDGYSLSQSAAVQMQYGPQRRMAGSFPLTQEILWQPDCPGPGTELSDEFIRRSLAYIGSSYHAIARLVSEGNGYQLTLELHGRKDGKPSRQFSRTLRVSDYGTMPGLIARTLLEHLERKLSPEELTLLQRPAFANEQDGILLNEILFDQSDGAEEFLMRNPANALAWEKYSHQSQNPSLVLEQIRRQQDRIQCDRMQVTDAILQRNLGRPRTAMAVLLKLIPTHTGDTYFYMTLSHTAKQLGDDRIMELILSNWRAAGTGYADSYYRATILKDWGWQARGEDLAVNVAPEDFEKFNTRLEAAMKELKQAVKLLPEACAPHAEMIQLAMALGLPIEFVDEQFHAALKKQPNYARVYHCKMDYLRPMWHGTPENLIPFAKECLASGLWENNVPQLTLRAIEYAYEDQFEGKYEPEPFRSPELWALIKSYFHEVVMHGSPEDQQLAMNYFALWGALGEHYNDVVSVFNELGYDASEMHPQVFPNRADFLVLWQKVMAATHQGIEGRISKVRCELHDGRLSEAVRILEAEKPNNFHESRITQHYRRAAELGRELQESKRLVFSGLQLKHAFDSLTNSAVYDLPGEVRDGHYVWKNDPTRGSSFQMLFPVGFRNGTLSGEFEVGPSIQYVGVSFRLGSGFSPVVLQYRPQASSLILVERHWSRYESQFDGSKLPFRIAIGPRDDIVEVNDAITWKLERDSISTGTFAIEVFSDPNQESDFTIKSLKLELSE